MKSSQAKETSTSMMDLEESDLWPEAAAEEEASAFEAGCTKEPPQTWPSPKTWPSPPQAVRVSQVGDDFGLLRGGPKKEKQTATDA